jgi:hypothetical protein
MNRLPLNRILWGADLTDRARKFGYIKFLAAFLTFAAVCVAIAVVGNGFLID